MDKNSYILVSPLIIINYQIQNSREKSKQMSNRMQTGTPSSTKAPQVLNWCLQFFDINFQKAFQRRKRRQIYLNLVFGIYFQLAIFVASLTLYLVHWDRISLLLVIFAGLFTSLNLLVMLVRRRYFSVQLVCVPIFLLLSLLLLTILHRTGYPFVMMNGVQGGQEEYKGEEERLVLIQKSLKLVHFGEIRFGVTIACYLTLAPSFMSVLLVYFPIQLLTGLLDAYLALLNSQNLEKQSHNLLFLADLSVPNDLTQLFRVCLMSVMNSLGLLFLTWIVMREQLLVEAKERSLRRQYNQLEIVLNSQKDAMVFFTQVQTPAKNDSKLVKNSQKAKTEEIQKKIGRLQMTQKECIDFFFCNKACKSLFGFDFSRINFSEVNKRSQNAAGDGNWLMNQPIFKLEEKKGVPQWQNDQPQQGSASIVDKAKTIRFSKAMIIKPKADNVLSDFKQGKDAKKVKEQQINQSSGILKFAFQKKSSTNKSNQTLSVVPALTKVQRQKRQFTTLGSILYNSINDPSFESATYRMQIIPTIQSVITGKLKKKKKKSSVNKNFNTNVNFADYGNEIKIMVQKRNIVYNDEPCCLLIFSDSTQHEKIQQMEFKQKLMQNLLNQVSAQIQTPMRTQIENLSLLVANNSCNNSQTNLKNGDHSPDQHHQKSPKSHHAIQKEHKQLKQILHQSTLVSYLTQLLQDSSSLEQGIFKKQQRGVQLKQVIHEVQELVKEDALDKGIQLKQSINKLTSDEVSIDVTRLQIILYSLLHNAIKFSFHKNTQVSISAWSIRVQNQDNLFVQVSDQGIGILQEELNLIWQPFFKSNHKFSQQLNPNGKGLSLSVCRQIAIQLKGALQVESLSGNGASFTLSLPYERIDQQNGEGKDCNKQPKHSILSDSNSLDIPNLLIKDNDDFEENDEVWKQNHISKDEEQKIIEIQEIQVEEVAQKKEEIGGYDSNESFIDDENDKQSVEEVKDQNQTKGSKPVKRILLKFNPNSQQNRQKSTDSKFASKGTSALRKKVPSILGFSNSMLEFQTLLVNYGLKGDHVPQKREIIYVDGNRVERKSMENSFDALGVTDCLSSFDDGQKALEYIGNFFELINKIDMTNYMGQRAFQPFQIMFIDQNITMMSATQLINKVSQIYKKANGQQRNSGSFDHLYGEQNEQQQDYAILVRPMIVILESQGWGTSEGKDKLINVSPALQNRDQKVYVNADAVVSKPIAKDDLKLILKFVKAL